MNSRYGTKVAYGDRLAWWKIPADETYWYNKFQVEVDAIRTMGSSGTHKLLIERISNALPTEGKILEAGCGSGWVVNALLTLGHDVEGVDFSQELVSMVKAKYPDLPVSHGNVLSLNVPDGYYHGYISLGVIEHRQDGCEPFLLEAHRVLSSGGIIYVSVPYFNLLRKLRYGLFRRTRPEQMEFYQYGFTKEYFRNVLESTGFRVLRFEPIGVGRGIREDLHLIYRILNRRPTKKVFQWLETQNIHFGTHMIAAVAVKV